MAKKKKNGIIAEFKQFIMRGNVIDLAVGVIIGAAFQAIVNSLVKDVITPCIGALFGNMDFSELAVTLKDAVVEIGADGTETIVSEAVLLKYGSFITAIINFLLMAIVIFIIIKVINTVSRKLQKPEEVVEAAPTTKMCPFCKTEIALEATRCPNCTSQLEE
ncbi:MAG: large conductance mechanosensitive channel protein MscL [Clostridia bacterium]|nr:large conductance mechanosensitive channel protein MscL [Clostridia bacterium]